MAIKREFYRAREDGVWLYRTYSDEGKKLLKIGTNEHYDEAIDVDNALFAYIEVNNYFEGVG